MSYDHKKVIDKLVEDCNLQEGDIFIDLGANLGQELDVIAPMGVLVHSFEPHPELFKTIQKNHGHRDNVTLHNAAAWIYDGDITFFFKNSKQQANGGASLIEEKTNINRSLKETVPCVDISRYLKEFSKPVKVLKIDVEGAEYYLLERLIKEKALDNIEFIYCEDHERKCTSSEWATKKREVLSELRDRGIQLRDW